MSSTPSATPQDTPRSKTQIKQALLALQTLGETLLALSPGQLARFPLSTGLRETMAQANAMKPGNTRRRQIQRIGKLLRTEDIQAIEQQLQALQQQDQRHHQQQQQANHWLEQLLTDPQALSDFITQHPHCDRQPLTQHLRKLAKAHKPADKQALFRWIYRVIEEGAEQTE